MAAIWIAMVLGACTVGGALAVFESTGTIAMLVKVLYALSTLGLAAYLAMHGEESTDAFAPKSHRSAVADMPGA